MKIYGFNATTALCCGALFTAGALFGAEADFLSEEDFYEEEVAESAPVSDPFESINRYTFQFNDFVYLNLLQPLANGYQAITPDPVEESVNDFFDNLKYPVRLVGNLLQGRLKGAWVETGRFVINTGSSLGFMTPADGIEMFQAIPSEDIGQALGSWGMGEGPYLVLPLLGPSNLRDIGGYVGDRAVNPLQEPFSLIDDWAWEVRLGIGLTELTTASPALLDRYLQLKGAAIDPYSALRNGYTQYRRAAIVE
ncbi:MAG: MlaA family lipoprotein [Opitutales bacterium]